MRNFLQWATSTTSNKQILQWVTSDSKQWETSATSNEQILQRVTSDFTTSNEQLVKSYASVIDFKKNVFLINLVEISRS